MNKIIYKCKKCNWNISLPEMWGDLRPQFCGNKKCLHSFRKYTDDLLIIFPEIIVVKNVPLEIKEEIKQKVDIKKSYKKEEILDNNLEKL